MELGETIEEAVVREIKEETGIEIRTKKLITIFDSLTMDDSGKVRFHYVLFEFLCERLGGDLHAGSDVGQARWVQLNDLDSLDIMPWTRRFIEKVRTTFHSDFSRTSK